MKHLSGVGERMATRGRICRAPTRVGVWAERQVGKQRPPLSTLPWFQRASVGPGCLQGLNHLLRSPRWPTVALPWSACSLSPGREGGHGPSCLVHVTEMADGTLICAWKLCFHFTC